ncbi:Probable chorismate pyruvate-lyase [Mycoavidus cysteinexigens]|uniref:Probable chorismate pyruvate-lyase n=2 Tax=Mycoavidus cysteinexigens TaxID=1553431 RepID=A0A2Z6ETX7_9BURK|nr:Probable chorismate pyruvate-lyase [Mycoavidus cysteinexigens]GAM52415.1 chorismate--pyruvate lyase [bacterium endosymbiont of Mortierella elongata FMR23-6]GLR02199.1 putative chorismate pyruvate-lyase [Mycoavidus cysteinexigens]
MRMLFNAANAQWRVLPRPLFSAAQKNWLTRGGSLTQRLQTLGRVEVQVVREAVDFAWAGEAHCLKARARQRVWAREVLLLVEGEPFIAARSIAPLPASRGVWADIRQLHTRSLSELLYGGVIKRSALASRPIGKGDPLYHFIQRCFERAALRRDLTPPLSAAPVARRSIFMHAGQPLLVTECMLAALWLRLAEPNRQTG